MFPNQTKAMIRRYAALFMTDSCVIFTTGESGTDSMGAPIYGETTIYDGPCRVITSTQSTAEQTRTVGEQAGLIEEYRLVVPYGTALAVDQRVRVGNVEYSIVNVRQKHTDKTDAQAIMVKAVG